MSFAVSIVTVAFILGHPVTLIIGVSGQRFIDRICARRISTSTKEKHSECS
jgi:hypothetical protein